MAAVNLKPLKQWYRDSAGVPKKVIAKTRYLTVRIRVRAIRAAWTALSLPTLVAARMQLRSNPVAAQARYQKLVSRNPWISGALNGLIDSANLNGDIQTALSAALKRDRLLQINHGNVPNLWSEFLLGEGNWFLPLVTCTGAGTFELNEMTLAYELKNLTRVPNYTESSLAVVVEQIASRYSDVELKQPTNNLGVVLVGLAFGIHPIPVDVKVFSTPSASANQAEVRRSNRFEDLRTRGFIEVQP